MMEAYGNNAWCTIATMGFGFNVHPTIIVEARGSKYKEGGKILNWEAIIDIVQKYWVQQICVLIVAIISW